ncbi:hypothetical protein FQN55_009156 [Onygenales sp. PD_40]|nr:hypothetical protein FQN55_009156 [Onygenales sp. PD_40]KAK2788694.1 hypothetical protein FQN53_003203 [Emmonsiellopsis sp. PD_33]
MELTKLRPVGRLERCSTARHSLGFYKNVAVTATYTLPSTSAYPIETYIYEACKTLIAQHPILSAIPLAEETNDPYFVRLPEIHLGKCILFKERQNSSPASNVSGPERDLELDELLNLQHNTGYSSPSPFWRLCILTDPVNPRTFTAAFVFHHAIGDGGSGKAFHTTFLQALSRAISSPPPSDEVDTVVASPQDPLLPTYEDLLPMTVTVPFLISTLFKHYVWNSRDPSLWTGAKVTAPLTARLHHIAFSKETTTSLKNLCRKNETTITAALQTTVAGALFTRLEKNYSSLECAGVISSRRWLRDAINDDSMGVWLQDFHEHYSREKFFDPDGNLKIPWDEARRSRKTIEAALKLEGKNALPNMLKYVNNYHNDLYLSTLGKDRQQSFEVSNVGIVKANDADSNAEVQAPQIGRMLFSQSASVAGPAISVSVITGGDGCLTLAFSWQEGIVEAALMDHVIETIGKVIGDLQE